MNAVVTKFGAVIESYPSSGSSFWSVKVYEVWAVTSPQTKGSVVLIREYIIQSLPGELGGHTQSSDLGIRSAEDVE